MEKREAISRVGTVLSTTFSPPESAPMYAVRLETGEGVLSVKWLGRREVPGVGLGSKLEVKGIPVRNEDTLDLINPDYQLLKASA
ncbi:MAG: OB-fold nucleic acid binding domain-containing protein [Mobiluncus porci]|uniref:OB-fold nucleic acid binding domain-containing protein n=1 Tax=Mobiluncus porci TaxID=2652278 RepID=A0A7K0JZX3_9ACTO|nr:MULTISPECIES: OB-fold nucleic acid binding domain-containing protein [Mobiluncus]MCI6585339.1 OB-fold nucleic acid binding domain-containing protein [Mobiluncus sp.]MDD7541452.1 OB-fold nucleic acid binding domain-containing protein [Mobiluncus porci]MDY5748437.1 OB-fold nucleic acid binding domain-containing protein [Mobiluncus porci]MST48806.1 OB-fold nucleic acid binding domain-containing protein [Mobiluncus porci]